MIGPADNAPFGWGYALGALAGGLIFLAPILAAWWLVRWQDHRDDTAARRLHLVPARHDDDMGGAA